MNNTDTASPALVQPQPPPHIINTAIYAACKSPCTSRRGVVIWGAGGEVISIGYNHQPAGLTCTGMEGCRATCRYTAVHAEQHALLRMGHLSVSAPQLLHIRMLLDMDIPVISTGPSCVECSKLILDCGIRTVWLLEFTGWHAYTAEEFHTTSVQNSKVIPRAT